MRAPADDRLFDQAWDGLVEQTRLIGRHAPGAHAEEAQGWLACVVPGSFDSSLINCAVPKRRAQRVGDALQDVAGAYERAGVRKWGVWLDSRAAGDARALAGAGLVLDSTPVVMAAELGDMDLGDTIEARPVDLPTVGRVNDLAYGTGDGRLERAIAHLPPDAVRPWGAGDGGEIEAVVMTLEHGEDACVWFVATAPQARRRGLASRLIRTALADSRQRGATSTTLWASAMGAPVYERLGYRPVGRLHLWEGRA
jgi:GNAT superfamily N-acetyltransferase